MPRYHPSVPGGFAKGHLRRTRERLGLSGLVEIHHVIPREFRSHPAVRRFDYDVEAGYNTILMPTAAGRDLSEKRFVHSNGHRHYNRYARHHLDQTVTWVQFLWVVAALHRYCRGR